MIAGGSRNITASALISSTETVVLGVIVNSHSSGTLKLWDNTSAVDSFIMNTFSFPAGSGVYMFGEGIKCANGLYATVGGTLNCQILTR